MGIFVSVMDFKASKKLAWYEGLFAIIDSCCHWLILNKICWKGIHNTICEFHYYYSPCSRSCSCSPSSILGSILGR